jgi:hypothetical protein
MPRRLMMVINRIIPMTATVYWNAIIGESLDRKSGRAETIGGNRCRPAS